MPLAEHLLHLRNEEERDDARAEKVDTERIALNVVRTVELVNDVVNRTRLRIFVIKRRQQGKPDEVQNDVDENEQQLECSELDRTLLESQQTEENGLERIERHHHRHHPHPFRMVLIVQCFRNPRQEPEDEHQEDRDERTNHRQCRGKHRIRFLLRIVRKSEESRFHSERKNHENQSRKRINIRDFPISSTG